MEQWGKKGGLAVGKFSREWPARGVVVVVVARIVLVVFGRV